jgi:predicted metal-dependent hydrolase
LKKLLRQTSPEPQQLSLQLDFCPHHFSADPAHPAVDSPAPHQEPGVHQSVHPMPGLAAPLTPGKRRVQIKDHLLDYTLLRSKRRSIGFVIETDGLRVTAPRWVTIAEIENGIREKQRWILAKLNERREYSARRLQPQMQWRDGATLPYLGNDITLRIVATQHAGISFDAQAGELTVCLPPDATEQQLKDRVQGWLQTEAKRLFAERLPLYAEKLGVRYHSFALSSAMTQWGSCTVDGKIRLNWRLMHFALTQIDYVIAHELAHLREMNHSPRFWATVQSIFPGFEAAKKALRERGPETLPAF